MRSSFCFLRGEIFFLMRMVLASLIFAALGGLLCADSPGSLPDPVPIQRLVLPPARLEQELQRAQDGVREQMSRRDFEELVQRAARAKNQPAPRLVEARYHATLEGDGLVGSGKWKVLHAGDEAGLLSLAQPQLVNLALRSMRFENGDALVGDFDGKHPALLIERSGEHTVTLEWSARGETRPDGMQVELKVPPCPLAVLEIDVPADRLLTPLNGLLLSGPHPASAGPLRRWQIACGNRSLIRFLIRRADPPTPSTPELRLVRQKTLQKVYPEGVEATYEMALEMAPYAVRELVCECDPQLRPREVIVPHLDSWTIQPGTNPQAPSRLVIRLRQPLREGTLQVSCLAPLASGPEPSGSDRVVSWKSPRLHLAEGVARGETLELWLHPDLRMEDWHAGGFRLVGSVSEEDAERHVRMQHLTLEGGGIEPTTPASAGSWDRPRARFRAGGAQFRARELAWWRIDGAGMQLVLQIAYEVRQGRLFQLPVQLPAGWEVERVELSVPGLIRSTSVRPPRGHDGATLLVDLLQPLEADTAGTAAPGRLRARPLVQPTTLESDLAVPPTTLGRGRPLLTVALRPTQPLPRNGATLPFPDAQPVGALFREGVLAIDVDEQVYRARVQTAAAHAEAEEEGPWGVQPPDHYFRYFGQAVSGSLHLEPRPPRLRARCENEVFVASGGAAVEMRLELEAEVGSPDVIDLYISAPGLDPHRWRNGREAQGGGGLQPPVREAVRLPAQEAAPFLQVLGAGTPVQAAVLLAACPQGELWRLHLARPLRVREPLHLHITRPLQAHDGRWLIPLPVVVSAHRMEGEVTLHLAGADLVQLELAGLRETAAEARGGPAAAWRTFRYGQEQVSLALVGQMLAGGRPTEAVLDAAQLITYVSASGTLHHHLTFQVANWPQRTLPLPLPPGTMPVAAAVDGHWLPRLVHVRQELDESEETLELPVPQREAGGGDSVHRFEVVYASQAERGWLRSRVRAPLPALPVAPLHFEQRWRLPPSLLPLYDGRYQRVPGTGERFAPARAEHRLTDFFRLAPDLSGPWKGAPRETEQMMLLGEAGASLRRSRAGEDLPLRQVVELVVFKHLQDRQALVVDDRALHEAGLEAETLLPIRPDGAGDSLPWEERGLTIVYTPHAILLTTRRQRDAWTGPGEGAAVHSLSSSLKQAIADAVRNGQDPSGRFQSALTWLDQHSQTRSTAAADRPVPPLVSAALDPVAWSEWEEVSGLAGSDLVLVPANLGRVAGLLLTGLYCVFFWRLWSAPGPIRFLLGLLTLTATGLGLLWLPVSLQEMAWWPFLACALGAVLWYLRSVTRHRSRPSPTLRRAVTAIAGQAGLVLLVLAAQTHSGPTTPAIVHLIPGPADGPEEQRALVPAELLTRLRALAHPRDSEARAVLLGARYEGKLVDGVSEWSAVFTTQVSCDAAVPLALPVDGVQLVGDVLLDGASVQPEALPASASQPGYSIEVRGKGSHKVELRLRVPVLSTDADRAIRFSIPPLLRSHLTLHLPAGASYPRALVKQGIGWEAKDAQGQILEVDLGRVTSPLQLAWHQGPPSPPEPHLQLKSAFLWDLDTEASTLTALLHYRIREGVVTVLTVKLPRELDVRSANAYRPLPVPPAASAPSELGGVALVDWSVVNEGGGRQLRLQLPYPVAGELQVLLELVPNRPLPDDVTLPLPEPQGRRLAEQQYLAYRVGPGLQARRQGWLGVTGIPLDQFAPFWSSYPRREQHPLAYACTIRREPRLSLHLTRVPGRLQASQEITWRVGPRLAELQAVLELTAPETEPVGVVEWELQSEQPITVVNVTGSSVHSWKQTGTRLRIWLHEMQRRVKLEMSGFMPLRVEAGQEVSSLSLPCLRLPAAQTQNTQLHLLPTEGLALVPGHLFHLTPVVEPPSTDLDRRYVSQEKVYTGRFQVRPAAGATTAHILAFAEVRDRRLTFTATVGLAANGTEVRRLLVRLRGWEDKDLDVQVDPEQVSQRRQRQRAPGEHVWILALKPGAHGSRPLLTLTGSIPVERAAGGALMPDIDVLEGVPAERWLAVATGELAAVASGPLQRQSVTALARWPGVAERLRHATGEAWQITGPEWSLRLVPSDRRGLPAPVRVFLNDQRAAVIDGQHWLHEMVCWLYHESHTDLSLVLPARARVVAVSVDGLAMTPLQPRPTHLWLPLPGRPGMRCIHLRWLYDQGEPLAAPNLECPQIEGAIAGPTLRTVLTPPGWDLPQDSMPGWLGTGNTRAAALDLARAEAQLQICQALAQSFQDSPAGALTEARRRRDHYCRQAERALEIGDATAEARGSEGEALRAWLKRLREESQAIDTQGPMRKGFSTGGTARGATAASQEVDSGPMALPLAGRLGDDLELDGTPMSWYSRGSDPTPPVHLIARNSQRSLHALAASGQWLAGLLLFALIAALPFGLAALRIFWPELVLLLALLGWYVAGPTAVVLLLLVLSGYGRIAQVVRTLRVLARRRAARTDLARSLLGPEP